MEFGKGPNKARRDIRGQSMTGPANKSLHDSNYDRYSEKIIKISHERLLFIIMAIQKKNLKCLSSKSQLGLV